MEIKAGGFTLVEIIIVIFILAILAGAAIAAFRFFQRGAALNDNAEQISNTLRLAQNRAISSLNASSCGIHFENSRYILFYGSPYNSSSASNEIFNLPSGLEIYAVNLAGGGQEIIFDRLTGRTSQAGNVGLRMASDHSQSKTIYVNSAGQISFTSQGTSPTGRIADSRHIHFNYNRAIDTNTEKITLSFSDPPNPATNQDIIIKDNLDANGQIYWRGTVSVGNSNQTIEVRTHQLNSPSSIFSINRDRRYNDKALTVTISGDGSGSLISYTAEGQEERGTSIYLAAGEAGNPQRQ